jgi:ABC-type transport system involved in cytochrome c biogenesis ATPase subunit
MIKVTDLRIGNASRSVCFEVRTGELLVVTGFPGGEGEELLQILSGLRRHREGLVEVAGTAPSASGSSEGSVFLSAVSSIDPSRTVFRQLVARHAASSGGSTVDKTRLDGWISAHGLLKESRARAGSLPAWMPRFLEFSLPDLLEPSVLVVSEPLTGMPARWSCFASGILARAREHGAVLAISSNPAGLEEIADRTLWIED